jgi:hypothetical protein
VVYMQGRGQRHQHQLLVGVCIDDLVITGGNLNELKQFKEEMKSTFQMADLGLLQYYLRLGVSQGEDGITVR